MLILLVKQSIIQKHCFDNYVVAHPEAKGMATTLTMLYIGTNGITVAHVGDSRIYQIRGNKILFKQRIILL